jgi:hypothetical protein
MTKAPIVLFVYSRPWHTEQCLESLAQCEGADESELYIFCDGPRRPDDKEAVEKVRKLVKSRNWCKVVHITEREKNMGLAKSIIAGVTEIVNRFGRIIVLEDDLILSSQFLNYMNDALEVYKDEERVMHISGYMFPVKAELPETFFFRGASCWGWATWKGAWEAFEQNAEILLDEFKKDKVKRREFDIEGSHYYFKILREQAKGMVDSWGIRWYASVFLRNGLCLHPALSLVKNIGHDRTGTHCVSTDVFDTEMNRKGVSYFAQDLTESEDAVRAIIRFNRAIVGSLPLRIFNRIGQSLKGLIKGN